MTREQWLVVNAMVEGARAADSCYCSEIDGSDKEFTAEEFDGVAEALAKELSPNMLENCICIMNEARILAKSRRNEQIN